MRVLIAAISVALLFGFSAQPAACQMPSGPSLGIGMEYDSVTGDTDDGAGGYLYYQLPMANPLSIMFELSFATGDFNVAAGEGSYSCFGLGVAFVFSGQLGEWIPYAGVGGANYFTDFDNVRYEKKQLSLFGFGGIKRPISEMVSLDVSVRYRSLLVDSKFSEIQPNPIDINAVVARAGIVLEF